MKSSLIFFVVIFSIQVLTAQNNPKNSDINKSTQSGTLTFTNIAVERFNGSQQNSEEISLIGYTGQPLKALQFDIIIGKDGGNLILKSVERGSGIPASSFLFDYEIYKGTPETNGSSIDTVKVLFLGNGMNELLSGQSHHIITINYDVAKSQDTGLTTKIVMENVVGATSTPVQNANVMAGEDVVIYLLKQETINEPKITLLQNYPNPFNPSTNIQFSIGSKQFVKLKVYDVLGNEIATLVNEEKPSGMYNVQFTMDNFSSGIYFYKLTSGEYVQTRRMVLIK